MASRNHLFKGILPFRPVLYELVLNLWHIRLFLVLVFLMLLVSAGGLFLTERDDLRQFVGAGSAAKEALFVTASAVLPVQVSSYHVASGLAKCLLLLDGLCGFVLLGLILWVVQESMSGQQLKRARYLIFPTSADLQ